MSLAECVAEIERAEVVAVDLEFSGLFAGHRKSGSVEEYYAHCRESVGEFLAVQLGVCCARRAGGERFVLSPFNFYLFPRARRTAFKADSLCLSWLRAQDFDFNRWLDEGLSYDRLSALACSYKRYKLVAGDLRETGAQRIIEAIIDSQKPLVLHNGLLDLLHIYDKFIAELPPKSTDFGKEVIRQFRGGVYDTKRIAAEGKEFIFPLIGSEKRSTTLDALRVILHRDDSRLLCQVDPHSKLAYALPTAAVTAEKRPSGELPHAKKLKHAAAQTRSGAGTPPDAGAVAAGTIGGTPPATGATPPSVDTPPAETIPAAGATPSGSAKAAPPAKDHEAGYDALMTMHLFLLETEAAANRGYRPSELPKEERERPAIPSSWEELPLLKTVRDKLEVVGIEPGYMDLRTKSGVTAEEIMKAPLFKNLPDLSTA